MFYPLLFDPIYKEMVWGGEKLSDLFNREINSSRIGESWDISCRVNDMGVVSNGKFKGEKFIDVINKDREGFLGTKVFEMDDFPLLVKIIDANQDLSVQVHPTDEYARMMENYPYGKDEIWYILDAEHDSYIVLGLKDKVTKEDFKNAIKENKVEDCLNKFYISKGDVISIPAGLIHAIGKGIVIAEIQQNSDITYRVYDYNRPGLDGNPRELHIEKALDVIDFEHKISKEKIIVEGSVVGDAIVTKLLQGKYFSLTQIKNENFYCDKADLKTFYILTVVDGNCTLSTNNCEISITHGSSVFIPAKMGDYTINGKCKILKSFL